MINIFSYFQNNQFLSMLFFPLMIWSLIIKGIALWKSARNEHKYWFVAILIVNSVGILELIYLLFFQKKVKPSSV